MSCIAWRDGYTIQSIISTQTNKKKPLASLVQPDEKEEEKIYQQLEAEMKRETSRYEVLHHLISLTFKSRSSAIDKIKEKDVTEVVMEQYPFLGNEKAVS